MKSHSFMVTLTNTENRKTNKIIRFMNDEEAFLSAGRQVKGPFFMEEIC